MQTFFVSKLFILCRLLYARYNKPRALLAPRAEARSYLLTPVLPSSRSSSAFAVSVNT